MNWVPKSSSDTTTPTNLRYPYHLSKSFPRFIEMNQNPISAQAIEALCGKWQIERVALDEFNR